MKRISIFHFTALCILLMSSNLLSQTHSFLSESTPTPDVLGPAPIIWWLGINAGMNLNQHSGDFITTECNCVYKDMSGSGLLFGGELSHKMSDDFGFVIKVLYDDKRASATNDTSENTIVLDEQGNYLGDYILPYERKLDVRLSYLNVNPMLQWYPLWGLYVQVGPTLSMRLNASYDYTKKQKDAGYVFKSNNQSETSIEKLDIPESQSLRLDLRAGVGYNLKLSRNMIFAPEVLFDYPLTKISSDDNWMVQTIHIIGVLKIAL